MNSQPTLARDGAPEPENLLMECMLICKIADLFLQINLRQHLAKIRQISTFKKIVNFNSNFPFYHLLFFLSVKFVRFSLIWLITIFLFQSRKFFRSVKRKTRCNGICLSCNKSSDFAECAVFFAMPEKETCTKMCERTMKNPENIISENRKTCEWDKYRSGDSLLRSFLLD